MIKKESNIFLFLILFAILFIIIYFTRFEKEITIKSKYVIRTLFGKGKYYIIDTNNNSYVINNISFSFNLNQNDKYNLLNINEKYKIYGYGFRINYLKIYPKIYDLKKI